jgi:hypothetical protein
LLEDGIDDIRLPEWAAFSYEVYKYEDMKKQWEVYSWMLGKSGLSLRNFGMWISDRDYLYFVDLNCVPRSSLDTFLLNIKGLGYLPTGLIKGFGTFGTGGAQVLTSTGFSSICSVTMKADSLPLSESESSSNQGLWTEKADSNLSVLDDT